MTIVLTNEEKMAVVEQHLKSIEYSIYGTTLDLVEANSVTTPDTSLIASLNARLADQNAKKDALLAEQTTLSA